MKTSQKILFLFVLSFSVAAMATAGARIRCENPVFDFGTIPEGSSVTNVFIISNIGDETLKVGKVRACCGASAQISGKSIEPGTNVQLRVVLSLRHRRGKQNKSLYVASDDPNQPFTQVSLKGNVIAPVYMLPSYIDMGKVKPGQQAEAVSTLFVQPGVKCSVTNVISSSKHFQAELTECPTSGVQRVVVRTIGTLPIGVNRASFKLQTNHKKYNNLRVRSSLSVASDIVTVPREILLKVKDGELKPVKRFISMKSRTQKKFSVKEVALPDPKMKYTKKSMPSGGAILTLSNITPFPDLDGSNIVIRVDHEEVKKIEVPVRIIYEDPTPYNVYMGRTKASVKDNRVIEGLDFGRVGAYRRNRRYFRLEFVPGVKIRVKRLESTNPLFSALYETAGGAMYRIAVTAATPVPYGKSEGVIKIITNSDDCPVIEMPVSMSCGEDLLVQPKELLLKEGGKRATRHFLIKHKDGGKFNIKRVTLAGGTQKFKVEKKNGKTLIAVEGIRPKAELEGKYLGIMTDSKSSPWVILPVRMKRKTESHAEAQSSQR